MQKRSEDRETERFRGLPLLTDALAKPDAESARRAYVDLPDSRTPHGQAATARGCHWTRLSRPAYGNVTRIWWNDTVCSFRWIVWSLCGSWMSEGAGSTPEDGVAY
jgi:hypothetical protein